MKNILIIGATGSLARHVIETASRDDTLQLHLFARNINTLPENLPRIQGDALNPADLARAMAGMDVVYINLAGDLAVMGANIVDAMKAAGVLRVVAICSIGIYDEPVKAVLKPYRALADIIEQSGLDYTVIRPDWFTHGSEIDYAITLKPAPEQGGAVSRRRIADFVCKIFHDPAQLVNANVGISKV